MCGDDPRCARLRPPRITRGVKGKGKAIKGLFVMAFIDSAGLRLKSSGVLASRVFRAQLVR